MVFSSNLFLFVFLPAFLLLYFGTPHGFRNITLFVASVFFYAFGAGGVVLLLIVSVLFNDAAARVLADPALRYRREVFVGAVIVNLLPLFYYKYLAFSLGLLHDAGIPVALAAYAKIPLPIGISFFTFQAVSYLADVYTGVVRPTRTTLEFGTYHTLFPQLVAGPIVRYVEIREAIQSRRSVDVEQIAEGAFRFCLGLAKKVILADNLAPVVDHAFSLPGNELWAPVSWFAVGCFSLQIYLDFSGYSDMAIGLGRILGFRFPENFDQPYRAQSVTEFWRRWHMTLTRWFRDYLYIPLGGNRKAQARTYLNLSLVFLLCGLWHGAALTFVIWGLYHGALLTIERILRNVFGWAPKGISGIVATVLLVTIGWVPFRATSVHAALAFLASMFVMRSPNVVYYPLGSYVNAESLTYFALGALVAFFPIERLRSLDSGEPGLRMVRWGGALVCLLLSIVMLSANSFRPFI
jgi:alginate O-acetyltransferase complex protein AlgI